MATEEAPGTPITAQDVLAVLRLIAAPGRPAPPADVTNWDTVLQQIRALLATSRQVASPAARAEPGDTPGR